MQTTEKIDRAEKLRSVIKSCQRKIERNAQPEMKPVFEQKMVACEAELLYLEERAKLEEMCEPKAKPKK